MLTLLGVGVLFFQKTMSNSFQEIEHEVLEEMHSMMHLDGAILQVTDPVHDYLLSADPSERGEFNRLSRKLDEAFKEARVVDFHEEKEREAIRLAWNEWQKARPAAEALLALSRPVGDAAAVRGVKRLDDQMDRIASLVEQAHNIADQEVKEETELAQAVRKKYTRYMSGIFWAGVFLVITCGFVLVRSILVPLRILEVGANHLGSGRLSHRVILNQQNEIGKLANAFNAMAEALEKSRIELQDLSIRDGLTGLYNPREFRRQLTEEIARSRRYGHPFSLLMLDIDFFKKVNDARGHPAGDEVLRKVAACILCEIRTTDLAARYGGEEFVVILLEIPASIAAITAERIRRAIADLAIPAEQGDPVNVTVSIGVASFPENAGSEQELIAVADRALYASKQAGRNRVYPAMALPELRKET